MFENRYIAILIAVSFLLLGASMLIVSDSVDAAEDPWEGDITINADGSFTPSDAPLKVLGNKKIYRLTDDVEGYIYVYRDKITLDGDGHTIIGDEDYWLPNGQIMLKDVDHCTVREFIFKDFYCFGIVIKGDHNTVFKCDFYLEDWWEEASGIEVHGSFNVIKKCTFTSPENWYSWMGVALVDGGYNKVLNCEFEHITEAIFSITPNNYIIANKISYGATGIYGYTDFSSCVIKSNKIMYAYEGIYIFSGFGAPHDNVITENIIRYNGCGISFCRSDENLVYNNNIYDNDYAFWIYGSYDNSFYHNNIIDNTYPFDTGDEADNTWDDGNGEGNYWSDYEGEDTNHDGVGDTDLPHNGVDYYPLMEEL